MGGLIPGQGMEAILLHRELPILLYLGVTKNLSWSLDQEPSLPNLEGIWNKALLHSPPLQHFIARLYYAIFLAEREERQIGFISYHVFFRLFCDSYL